MDSAAKPERLHFIGGWYLAFAAPLIFMIGVISYFVVFETFDMTALTVAGLLGLLAGALLARNYQSYWNAALRGIATPMSATLLLILLVVSLFAALLDVSGVAGGMVWLAGQFGLSGGLFPAVVFVLAGALAMATGSSISTLFTAFPILFPAGIALGADPLLLAGAILSGALFGDNIAPISDSTIVSATTQRYRGREGVADIAGVVRSRARYALTAFAASVVLYAIAGPAMADQQGSATAGLTAGAKPLLMLVAVAVLVGVAFWKRDIFLATSAGLAAGLIVAVPTGLVPGSAIIGAEDGAATGFLVTGVTDMLPLIGLGLVIFAIIGVLEASGAFDILVNAIARWSNPTNPRGAELTIGAGAVLAGGLFAGVNGPTMLFYGPLADRIGAAAGLHPYRRANVMDCVVLGIGSIVPVVSSFLLIASSLTADVPGTAQVSALTLFVVTWYPLVLTLVMLTAILTGWGRRFEGPAGEPVSIPARRSAGRTGN
ncbi:transporter (NhaC family) [Tamaricihabitans halophyticus]|uniref:Transporter (NhaC family) n=1 Tax=Tamaricihabitans halophyticus TaxID=1262583 RepID=A0A4R2QA36_9PSEU|nr:Na+/H+ antiporter NhaC family protein [Tamaricihabitans halophyticus]TCP45762.1 transporter (NhaC family) [Tamaricihabitans halophyticus]